MPSTRNHVGTACSLTSTSSQYATPHASDDVRFAPSAMCSMPSRSSTTSVTGHMCRGSQRSSALVHSTLPITSRFSRGVVCCTSGEPASQHAQQTEGASPYVSSPTGNRLAQRVIRTRRYPYAGGRHRAKPPPSPPPPRHLASACSMTNLETNLSPPTSRGKFGSFPGQPTSNVEHFARTQEPETAPSRRSFGACNAACCVCLLAKCATSIHPHFIAKLRHEGMHRT